MLHITTQSEPLQVKNLCAVIYGQPGSGKTTLSYTADKPLMLDFDGGSYRALGRKDSVQVKEWAEVTAITAKDLESYSTLVIDTAGRMLDLLAIHVMTENPKNGRGGGALTIQGYGALKNEFTAFVKLVRSFGKDLILVCHEKEERSGDKTIVRPDVVGGSLAEIHKQADLMGYMFTDNGKQYISFAPSEARVAKDSANLGTVEREDRNKVSTQLADIMAKAKSNINTRNEGDSAVMKRVMELTAVVDGCHTAAQANELVAAIITEPDVIKSLVRPLFTAKVKALGLSKSKETGAFE